VESWAPDLDDESPPPKPQRPTPPDEAMCKGRPSRSEKLSDDSVGRSNRVRGPGEVKTARDNEAEDECLPSGAHSADFKTLHAMIQRGIQDSESGAVKMEKAMSTPVDFGQDEEECRFRERQRQRRDQEEAQREKERQQARQKRRKEQEERERRQAEDLEREEREELAHREARARAEAQCRKELAAAMRIQSHVRGRQSRMGKPSLVREGGYKAVLHWEPLITGSMLEF